MTRRTTLRVAPLVVAIAVLCSRGPAVTAGPRCEFGTTCAVSQKDARGCCPKPQSVPLPPEPQPGTISDEVVRKTVLEHIPQFNDCWAKHPDVGGTMRLDFAIRADGTVARATDDNDPAFPAEFRRCVDKEASSIQFPSPEGGATTAYYLLRFEPRIRCATPERQAIAGCKGDNVEARGHVNDAWFSVDGRRLITLRTGLNLTISERLIISDTNDYKTVGNYDLAKCTNGEEVSDVSAISDERDTLALCAGSGADKRDLFLMETATGVCRRLADPEGKFKSSYCDGGLAFSPDGTRLLAYPRGAPRTLDVQVWDIASAKPLFSFAGPSGCHDVEGCAHASFSPDGRRIAAGGGLDAEFAIFDAKSGATLARLPVTGDHLSGLIFSPDGRWLFTSSWDEHAALWDPWTGFSLWETTDVRDARFLQGGKLLAVANDGTIASLDRKDGTRGTPSSLRASNNYWAASANGHCLAVPQRADSFGEPFLLVEDLEEHTRLAEFRGRETSSFDTVRFSDDGMRIMVDDQTETIVVTLPEDSKCATSSPQSHSH
jgi:WD40 repeat protein